MTGVLYCKRLEKIKEKEVFADSYDIGSYKVMKKKKNFLSKDAIFL